MAHNFIACDRDQQFLLPPSLNDWLPEGHLARFIVGVMEQLDLTAFYKRRRNDGWGRPAFDPKMMVALLLYAYCTGVRSSRQIERRCTEDIAFRFIAANECPDHATIARFRQDNDKALAALFTQALRLCVEAGLVKVGVVALDGTKVKADAALSANRTRKAIEDEVNKILAEAEATDTQEDEAYGKERRGDELPQELADATSRLARLKAAKQKLDDDDGERRADYEQKVARVEEHRAKTGKRPKGRPPKPPTDRKRQPSVEANPTDPESRIMKAPQGFIQGCNAQAMTTEKQIVIAASVTQDGTDHHRLSPMLDEAKTNLEAAGASSAIGTLLADAGYFTDDNAASSRNDGPELLIATAKERKQPKVAPRGRIPNDLSPKKRMERKLATKKGQRLYKKRSQMVEPVFGQHRMRGLDHFMRRGRDAADCEWRFENTAHNLLKLWRSGQSGTPIPHNGAFTPSSKRPEARARRASLPGRLLPGHAHLRAFL